MKSIVKILMLAVMFVLVGCSSTSPATPTAEPEAIRVQLSWQHGSQFLGYYIAQEQGYYNNEGLAVTLDPLSDASELNKVSQSIVDGDFDFSMADAQLISDQVSGIPVVAIGAIEQLTPVTFFAASDSGIVTLENFVGQRIVIKSEGWQEILEDLLAHGGLTLDDVELVPGSFDMTPFYEGEVDIWAGYLNNEVIRARQQGLELVTFPAFEYAVNKTMKPLYTKRELLQTNPDIAVRFLRATQQGWEWAVENSVEAVDIMLVRFPELADDRAFHIASFEAYIPLIRPTGVRIGSIDCDAWLNSDERFNELESTEGLCTTEIFEQATQLE